MKKIFTLHIDRIRRARQVMTMMYEKMFMNYNYNNK